MWRDHRGTGALYVLLSAGGAAAAAGALTTASAARDAVGARTRTRTGQRSSVPRSH